MKKIQIKTGRQRAYFPALLAALAVLAVLLVMICFSGGSVHAYAYTAEEQAALDQLEEEVRELLEALNTDELQAYLDSLSQFEGTEIKDVLAGLVTGDLSLEYDSMWEAVLSLLWEEGKVMLPAFAVILAVAVLCSILNSAKNGFLQSSMSDINN